MGQGAPLHVIHSGQRQPWNLEPPDVNQEPWKFSLTITSKKVRHEYTTGIPIPIPSIPGRVMRYGINIFDYITTLPLIYPPPFSHSSWISFA